MAGVEPIAHALGPCWLMLVNPPGRRGLRRHSTPGGASRPGGRLCMAGGHLMSDLPRYASSASMQSRICLNLPLRDGRRRPPFPVPSAAHRDPMPGSPGPSGGPSPRARGISHQDRVRCWRLTAPMASGSARPLEASRGERLAFRDTFADMGTGSRRKRGRNSRVLDRSRRPCLTI
jgi:hypothetical protein